MEPERDRTCGACQLCCELLAVQALGKPMGQRCEHQSLHGCDCYEQRPFACRRFECLWLVGVGGSGHRPDRIHAVWSALGPRGDLVIHEEAGHEGEGRAALGWAMRVAVRSGGRRVFLYVGADDERRDVTPPGEVADGRRV